MWVQREITLRPRPRGFHLVTDEVVSAVPELRELRVGLSHLFILHTSASLTLNENASPDVRRDFETWFNARGARGLPRTGRTRSKGPTTCRPTSRRPCSARRCRCRSADGRLALGTWQGIYLCEHRDHGGARSLVVTLFGES